MTAACLQKQAWVNIHTGRIVLVPKRAADRRSGRLPLADEAGAAAVLLAGLHYAADRTRLPEAPAAHARWSRAVVGDPVASQVNSDADP
jgi:hypothetical protein